MTDKGLEYLLDLNGEILIQDDGGWIKNEARRLNQATKECPHGIKYSLTLHDRSDVRMLGFDNAHPVKIKKKGRFVGRKIAYDHKHEPHSGGVMPYIFQSTEQLVTDFFAEVDRFKAAPKITGKRGKL